MFFLRRNSLPFFLAIFHSIQVQGFLNSCPASVSCPSKEFQTDIISLSLSFHSPALSSVAKNQNLSKVQTSNKKRSTKEERLKRQSELENMCEISSKRSELSLITLAQEADRLFQLNQRLADDLGREPSFETWAAESLLPVISLERKIALGIQAKNDIVTQNIGLVRSAINTFGRTKFEFAGLTLQEIELEAACGLILAVENFKISKNTRFKTFASWWIHSTIKIAAAGKGSVIRVPCQTLQDVSKIRTVNCKLAKSLGRQPSEKELCGHLGWSIRKLRTFDIYIRTFQRLGLVGAIPALSGKLRRELSENCLAESSSAGKDSGYFHVMEQADSKNSQKQQNETVVADLTSAEKDSGNKYLERKKVLAICTTILRDILSARFLHQLRHKFSIFTRYISSEFLEILTARTIDFS